MVDDGGDSNTLASIIVQIKSLLAVLAVAERAADQEQLPALGDQLVVGVGGPRLRRGERGVDAAGQQQAEEQQESTCEGAAAVAGESPGPAIGPAVHVPHAGDPPLT